MTKENEDSANRPRSDVPRWLEWRGALAVLCVLWPVWTLFRLLQEHGINAPFLDDFMTIPLLEKAGRHELTLHDFFAAQMEHRIALTRVVMLALHKAWPGHYFIAQIWFSFVLLCLTLANVAILVRKSAPAAIRVLWVVPALAALTLFSPVQHVILLWPFMHQVTGLLFLLTSALVVWQARWPVWARFIAALVCVLGATLSFTSGIIMWLVMLPVILWCAPMSSSRMRAGVLAGWLLAFVVTMALYFHNLKNEVPPEFSLGQMEGPTMSRNVAAFLEDPAKSLAYAVRILGAFVVRGAGRNLMDASLQAGSFLAAVYLCCLGWCAWRFRDGELRRRLVPWLALGAYSIGTALAIALGRVWFSDSGLNALSGRYVIHAAGLTIALPALVWIVAADVYARREAWRAGIARGLSIAATVLAVVLLTAWNHGERMMAFWSSSCIRGAVNTMFYRTSCPVEYDAVGIPGLAKRADDLHLLKPPMLKNGRLDQFQPMPRPLNENFAQWTGLRIEKSGDGLRGLVEGRAVVKKNDRVADGVFLAFRADDGHWEIFHVTQVNSLPLYLAEAYGRDLEFTYAPPPVDMLGSVSRFTARFPLAELPPGPCRVAAWAYDWNTGRVMLIPGFFEVNATQGTVKELGTDIAEVGFGDRVAWPTGAHP